MVKIPKEIREIKRPPYTVVTPQTKDGRYPVRLCFGREQSVGRVVGHITDGVFRAYGEYRIDTGEFMNDIISQRELEDRN